MYHRTKASAAQGANQKNSDGLIALGVGVVGAALRHGLKDREPQDRRPANKNSREDVSFREHEQLRAHGLAQR
jgi:hypothetical protein